MNGKDRSRFDRRCWDKIIEKWINGRESFRCRVESLVWIRWLSDSAVINWLEDELKSDIIESKSKSKVEEEGEGELISSS